MSKKKPPLSKASSEAVNALVATTIHKDMVGHSWLQGRGSLAKVRKAHEEFTAAERRLRARLLKLERACQFAQGVAELYRRKLEERDGG